MDGMVTLLDRDLAGKIFLAKILLFSTSPRKNKTIEQKKQTRELKKFLH